MNNRSYYGIDLSFTRFLQSTFTAPIFLTIAKVFSFIFDDIAYIVTVVAITLAIFVSKKNKRYAVIVLVGGGLWAVTWLFKRIVNRPRPSADLINVWETNTNGSFPSGHVMAAFLLLGALCFVLYLITRKKSLTTIAVILSSVIVIAVMLSRVYIGAHWLTDCLGGVLTAFSFYIPFVYLANLYLKAYDKITNIFKKKR
ncbi:MAG: phosphatase PAP2 family protein [Dehalococcoidales bacterium]|nr:phosphatase PAP2 family protein [Dehalococcoidales bacterium]